MRRGDAYPKDEVVAYLHAPDEVLAPLLPGWTPPKGFADVPVWMRPLIARHELAVRDQVLRIARSGAPGGRGLLVPFRDAEIAARMAEWLARRAGSQRPVRAWFGRHGLAAVPLLVPAALGGATEPRRHAEHALRFVADRTDADRGVEAARGHGDAAADAVRRMLAGPDPVLPLRNPRNPAWADARALPQVLLRDRSAALPAEATGHLVSALALADPGAADVRAACDPASLAEFGWALSRRGAPMAPRPGTRGRWSRSACSATTTPCGGWSR
ncbi:hypothetical protein ACFHW2_38610 [Actinomadura sp. LOL_016]|uniref:hypothetical protein n=1 Tax=unclassified Actinomadura TaxID=2626254 RepID=UPI003A809A62